MTSDEIKAVMALMERHGIAEFEHERAEERLFLTLGKPTIIERPNEAGVAADGAKSVIASPGVGIFLSTHPTAQAQPLPRSAARGEVVGYIKTGPMLRAVRAVADCELHRALVAEETGVGYGDPLFECSGVSPNYVA